MAHKAMKKAMKTMKKVSARSAKRHYFDGKLVTMTEQVYNTERDALGVPVYDAIKTTVKDAATGLVLHYRWSSRFYAMKKAMQTMKKVSAGLAKRHVFAGKLTKTHGGLAKGDLIKSKRGKIVSKKASAKATKNPWIAAVAAARKALNLTGFVKIKKGWPLHTKAKALYKK